MEYFDAFIVDVHMKKCIVHMGTYVDTLSIIFESVYNDEEYLGFEIGINTFKNGLYAQLLTSIFCNGNLPGNDFEPGELMCKYVRLVVGRENGDHLLGFRPFPDVTKKKRHFYGLKD